MDRGRGQQQRARAKNSIVIPRRTKEIKKNRERGGASEHYKKPAAKVPAFLELTKGDTAVFRVRKVENTVDDRAVSEPHVTDGPGLARLIHQIHGE